MRIERGSAGSQRFLVVGHPERSRRGALHVLARWFDFAHHDPKVTLTQPMIVVGHPERSRRSALDGPERWFDFAHYDPRFTLTQPMISVF
jgi:hypothetical protein